jgi:hypothetical protein
VQRIVGRIGYVVTQMGEQTILAHRHSLNHHSRKPRHPTLQAQSQYLTHPLN